MERKDNPKRERRSISDDKHKNSKVENTQEDQRADYKNPSFEISIIRIFAGYGVDSQSQKTAERVHDEIGDVGDADGEGILDNLSRKTKREYHGELIPKERLFEINAEHHSEWDEGNKIRDHFTVAGACKRDQVETPHLKTIYDREGLVGEFEQNEPQQDEQVCGEQCDG
jgi:hypothetical protein